MFCTLFNPTELILNTIGLTTGKTLNQNTQPKHSTKRLNQKTQPKHSTKTLNQNTQPKHSTKTLNQNTQPKHSTKTLNQNTQLMRSHIKHFWTTDIVCTLAMLLTFQIKSRHVYLMVSL